MTNSSTSSPSVRSVSDEEVSFLLASSKPKKRAGRKKFKETRHPVYRGVRRRNNDKWVCELREPSEQKRIWLGTYPTPEMAARAHDVAALALRGHLATLNFADSAWRLPAPASNDPKDLRQAAVQAAEAFRPREENDDEIIEEVDGGAVGMREEMQLATSHDQNAEYNWMAPSVLITEDVVHMEDEIEGRLFSPNPCLLGTSFSWDDVESDVEVSLWSYTL